MDLKEHVHAEEGGRLKVSLEKALSSIKDIEKETSLLKDEVMVVSDQYYERKKERVGFFYPNLD